MVLLDPKELEAQTVKEEVGEAEERIICIHMPEDLYQMFRKAAEEAKMRVGLRSSFGSINLWSVDSKIVIK